MTSAEFRVRARSAKRRPVAGGCQPRHAAGRRLPAWVGKRAEELFFVLVLALLGYIAFATLAAVPEWVR